MFANELSLEDVRALYFDETALREPPYKLYRATGEQRWYYRPDLDKYYPSVTTVIHATTPMSPGLLNYLKNHPDPDGYRDERAAYGTWLHMQCASFLINGEYDFDDMPASLEIAALNAGLNPASLDWHQNAQKDILAFAAFCRDHSVEPLAIEVVLASEQGWAGAIDIVCNMKIGSGANGNFIKADQETGGIPITAIVDIKSGNIYPSHATQLGMYEIMWEENFPDVEIDAVFNFSPRDWRSSPSYQLKNQTENVSAELIDSLVRQFRARNTSGPSSSLVVSGKLTRENIDQCYKHQDLRDRFQEEYQEVAA